MATAEGLDAVIINTAGGDGRRRSLRHRHRSRRRRAADASPRPPRKRSIARSVPTAEIDVKLDVGPGGTLAWLPQETILFDRARLRRRYRCRTCSRRQPAARGSRASLAVPRWARRWSQGVVSTAGGVHAAAGWCLPKRAARRRHRATPGRAGDRGRRRGDGDRADSARPRRCMLRPSAHAAIFCRRSRRLRAGTA